MSIKPQFRILLIGGYGIFGSRIAERLAKVSSYHLIIAGRTADRAEQLVGHIKSSNAKAEISVIECDIRSPASLQYALNVSQCQLVINASGPYQDADFLHVRQIIQSGIHYIDMADSRRYVCNFSKLDSLAKQYGVLAITGASSVPALSSAIADNIAKNYLSVSHIDIGISPGNKTPRGSATVRSILSYCGRPFLIWHDRIWKPTRGWQGLTRRQYPSPMGKRWLSDCDVPDLTLFQSRYAKVKSVRFRAGLELGILHIGTWILSYFVQFKILSDLARYSEKLKIISEWLISFGTQTGGMHVELEGIDKDNNTNRTVWYLIADRGDGPQVPCTAAVILAKKFSQGTLSQTGAIPCLGLISKSEFDREFSRYHISQVVI